MQNSTDERIEQKESRREKKGERERGKERGNSAECRVQSSVAGSAVRRTYMLALVINIL